ncbi:Membrane-bound metal-dependent hydrolase [Planctomycetales bacterium 10988]|nr:Membrane-bound metal-dependent hydrolase [Planctomycetales bacterium 10988]
MADFKTHIAVSSLCGAGYAGAGYLMWDFTWSTSCLTAGLCGLAGMLPDLDSDSGIPLRETLAFSAAVIPLLMIERFALLGMTPEEIALSGASVYFMMRFGVGNLLKRYTVHRGMFHSLPGMLMVGLVAFLVCQSQDLNVRYYKAGGVMLGYLSHLCMDELYSIEWIGFRIRIKKSFGTALKLYSRNLWGDASAYIKLILLTWLAMNDPVWMKPYDRPDANQRTIMAETLLDRIRK